MKNNICNECNSNTNSKKHLKCIKQEKSIELKICVRCKNTFDSAKHLICKKRSNKLLKKTRAQRQLLGLCTQCGNKPTKGFKICDVCKNIANTSIKKRRKLLKIEIFNHYGNKCNCCGEDKLAFLNIDHVNGGGRQHVKEIGNIYSWLKKNNYPEGFQILCANCNLGKYKNNGICPHNRSNS